MSEIEIYRFSQKKKQRILEKSILRWSTDYIRAEIFIWSIFRYGKYLMKYKETHFLSA
jgi:hypothetical protein